VCFFLRAPKALLPAANFLTTPNCRAKQNQLFRTNRKNLQAPPCENPPRRSADQLIPAISALTQIAPATPSESALTFLLNLKVFGISTYIFFCVEAVQRVSHFLRALSVSVSSVPSILVPALGNSQSGAGRTAIHSARRNSCGMRTYAKKAGG
jgi:hypothetical protein